MNELRYDSRFNKRRWRAGAATVALVFVIAGCKQRAEVVGAPSPVQSEPSESGAAPPAAAANVDVRVVDAAELDAIIADHRGKTVFVDFWATWCAPCIEQLPHTAELSREAESRGLVVITVSMDEPEDVASAAKVLANKSLAHAINLISRAGGGSRAMEAFAIEGGALPYYRLYDSAGNLHATFGLDPVARKQFTTDDLDAAVDKLLATP
jgi:thiol-disulfide isomerase/thioredoxin